MEEGAVMMVGLRWKRIFEGLRILESQKKAGVHLVHDYAVSNVSDKVTRIIISYTDYVRQKVWCNYGC
jgi:UDP-N-acetylglucosamine 2-epimerase (non-hydrolysing)